MTTATPDPTPAPEDDPTTLEEDVQSTANEQNKIPNPDPKDIQQVVPPQ